MSYFSQFIQVKKYSHSAAVKLHFVLGAYGVIGNRGRIYRHLRVDDGQQGHLTWYRIHPVYMLNKRIRIFITIEVDDLSYSFDKG